MTMPGECAQAVLLTRHFLLELSRQDRMSFEPFALRAQAAALLQHFPDLSDCEEGEELTPRPTSAEHTLSPPAAVGARQHPRELTGGRGFPRARRPPTESQTVHALVISTTPAFDLVWVRDERGCQYPLDRATKGVNLSDLRQGQALDCDLVVDGESTPRVGAARVVSRRYPKDGG